MPLKDPEKRREYHRQYMKRWYQQNKETHIAYVRAWNAKNTAAIRETVERLKDVPCPDCGQRFPAECMDFDHLKDKFFEISAAASGGRRLSIQRVMEEIKKCEVVCSNCHRVRTMARRRGRADGSSVSS